MDFVFHDILFLIGKLEAEMFGKERAKKALRGKLMLPQITRGHQMTKVISYSENGKL